MKTALHAEHALTNAQYQQSLRVTSILLILTSAQSAVLALLYARRKLSACRSKLIFHQRYSSWNGCVDLLGKTKPHCLLDVTVRLIFGLIQFVRLLHRCKLDVLVPIEEVACGHAFLTR